MLFVIVSVATFRSAVYSIEMALSTRAIKNSIESVVVAIAVTEGDRLCGDFSGKYILCRCF